LTLSPADYDRCLREAAPKSEEKIHFRDGSCYGGLV
jgi:hypothetical protein